VVKLSGVAFTRIPENGEPYYVINYHEGSSTIQITHGMSDSIIKIFRKTKLSSIPHQWKRLLSSIKELESILDFTNLDIEFGITPSNLSKFFSVV